MKERKNAENIKSPIANYAIPFFALSENQGRLLCTRNRGLTRLTNPRKKEQITKKAPLPSYDSFFLILPTLLPG